MATRRESSLHFDMLWGRRQYFIKKVKSPLVKVLHRSLTISKGNRLFANICLLRDVWLMVKFVNKYPEPTRENTKKRSTHVLLDVWDEFEKYNKARRELFKVVRRVSACECEHDIDYSQRITWLIKKLSEKYLSGEWPPLEPWAPKNFWKDPVVKEAWRKAFIEMTAFGTIGGRPVEEIET